MIAKRVLAAAALLLLAACSRGGSSNQAVHAPDYLVRGNGSEVKSLDPHYIDGQWEANVVGDALVGWTTMGYGPAQPRPRSGRAGLLTPPATVAALAAGYPVQIDDRARSAAGQIRSSAEESSSATDRYPHSPSVRSNSATRSASTSSTPRRPASPSASA